MENKGLVIRFGIIYFLSYVVYAAAYTEFVPFLTSLGYTASERGVLISAYAITNIIFQILFGFISDKFQNTKFMFLVAMFGYVLSSFLLFQVNSQMFWGHLFLISLSGGLVNTNFGMLDNWLFTYGTKAIEQFSLMRAFGSLGWAAVCCILGFVINNYGYSMLGYLCVVVMMLTFFSIPLVSEYKSTKPMTKVRMKISKTDIKELISDPKYKLLTITLFFIYCAIMASSSIVMDKFIILGANNVEIGYRWMILALVEIPIFIIGSRLLDKLGPYKMLSLAGGIVALQYFLFAFSYSVVMMLIVTTLQMLGSPILTIASRKLYYEYSSDKLKNTSILLALSIYQGLSMLLVPSLGGIITDAFGVNVSLFGIAFIAMVGFLLTFRLFRLVKSGDKCCSVKQY